MPSGTSTLRNKVYVELRFSQTSILFSCPAPGASLWLSFLASSMDSLDAMLESPPGLTGSRQPVPPPSDHGFDENHSYDFTP